MGILSSLKRILAPQKIADRGSLRAFMESRAAYLVQKSINEYSQARAGVLYSTMMREPIFLAGYERARWLSYPASISMIAEMVEGALRENTASSAGALDAALQGIAAEILAQYPQHSGFDEAFWNEATARVARDLAQAALAPPKPVQNIPQLRVSEIFDALPVNDQLKQHDFAMFHNTIRFHLTELKVEFEEKADMPRLAATLAA